MFGKMMANNPFSGNIPTSQRVEHFQELVNQQLQEQEVIKQKELEIQQQAETLQKATELEKNLQQAQERLGKLEKANRLLKNEEKETDQSFLNKLAKIPAPAEEERQLLANLYLTAKQYIAISAQAQYLTRDEQALLPENYPHLNTQQKLQLVNSGLNNLGIDNYEKKEKFVELNHTFYQEKQNFGLSQKEKESILRLLITTLDLTNEQRENLENMGLKLTLEQQEQLTIVHSDTFKTFSLTDPQKNILNSLSPLIREDKYSENSLQLLRSLNLKSNQQAFFTNEEIIPDPNTQFGTAKKKQKKLAAIALEDQEERQRIEKWANEEKAKIEAEIEIQLQETLAKELREAGRRQEELLKGRKNKQQALREFREQMYNACLDYP
ncbi:10020_t:CDS:2 [Cetraspora pellucida]|uniref:10020_t:CDS:1 n=1 Tax=Cetraspora pellucida TaxID=1433469 RepID=A0ACA9L2N6_9GLOM|nr:10020_t:CDS:2 [Cetraspora pellucida]